MTTIKTITVVGSTFVYDKKCCNEATVHDLPRFGFKLFLEPISLFLEAETSDGLCCRWQQFTCFIIKGKMKVGSMFFV